MSDNIQEANQTNSLASDEGQLVIFILGDIEFGVDINSVKEIVRLPEITPIPRSPEYVAGICNLRGNVLPVIDTRKRFTMDEKEHTESTRLLVLESGGFSTGLIVDAMRAVMRMSGSLVEVTPAVCKGVDKDFLEGVVKMDNGKRLILTLNVAKVIEADIAVEESQLTPPQGQEQASKSIEGSIEEEQLVSFYVSKEEYAFNIEKVREILRVEDITPVPNVSEYVKGLFTIRNQLMPVVDLRSLLGRATLVSERLEDIDDLVAELKQWFDSLKHFIESGKVFMGVTSSKESSFGKWLSTYNTSSTDIQSIVKKLKTPHVVIHNHALRLNELVVVSKNDAMEFLSNETEPVVNTMFDNLNYLKDSIEKNIAEDQRVMVVETGSINIGYLVDNVNEVVRIPKSIIDDTPSVAQSERKELKGVAKLNEGERLIMIMDEASLITQEDTETLTEAAEGSGNGEDNKREKTLAEQSLDEDQLVTFSISKQEYGVKIMDVQEINRIEEVTSVPRSPYFIDGVTNLRGNVIPVINVRTLFGLEAQPIDDRTRVIIVDISDTKTGLKVDQVNEVLRLSKSDIEQTPSIVTSSGDNTFMEGFCKINEGKRMIVLINVKRILSKDELENLSSLGGHSAQDLEQDNGKDNGDGNKTDNGENKTVEKEPEKPAGEKVDQPDSSEEKSS